MKNSETIGRIHSIESLGAADGPGLRTVIFLQGCPLRCRYCHNPDSWPADGGLLVTVAELVSRIKRFVPYHGEDGGVTLSGGEPLMQLQFTAALSSELRQAGIKTALDTSGWLPDPGQGGIGTTLLLDKIFENTDLIILDIKSPEPAQFQWLTGRPADNLCRFLDICEKRARQIWIRQVIVPGWNDQDSDMRSLADFLDNWPKLMISKVQLLPYHTQGEDKWQQLGYPYPLKGTPDMAKEHIDALQRSIGQSLAHRLPDQA